MKIFSRAYRLINLLSIDIALGAVICAAFFARVFQVSLRPYGLAALGVTVWIIYTADHLLDARMVTTPASSERHRLHQQYSKMLWLLVFVAVAIDGLLIIFIRKPVLIRGLMLAGVVVVYLLFQQYLRVLKEWVAAILYAGGVLMPSVAVSTIQFSFQEALLIFPFFMTAWINLLMFSWFGRKEDLQDNQVSIVTVMGEQLTVSIIWTQIILNGIIMVVALVLTDQHLPVVFLLLMNGILLILFYRRSYFALADRYRLLGDAIFLLPAIYLFL